jgi:hypothetical protein
MVAFRRGTGVPGEGFRETIKPPIIPASFIRHPPRPRSEPLVTAGARGFQALRQWIFPSSFLCRPSTKSGMEPARLWRRRRPPSRGGAAKNIGKPFSGSRTPSPCLPSAWSRGKRGWV